MRKLRRRFVLVMHACCLVMTSSTVLANELACTFQQFSNRVYVMVGADHRNCPAKELEHPVTNPSVIVGDSGVIVIDPGSSLQVGRLVLERLQLITDKPVVAVFNSHIHGLYWLGNQAVKERFPAARIYAHKQMIKRIESGEGEFWVEAITGKYDGEKTKYVIPDVGLSGGESESIAGLDIKVHHFGRSHTDHDLLVEVPSEQVVVLGGLVVEPEVPSQGVPRDANFEGQIDATQYAIDLNAKLYIPGRGHPEGVELPKRALRFLKALYSGTENYYKEGWADFEVSDQLKEDLSEYEQWYDFTRLGGVVSEMYLQIEQQSF